MKVSLPPIDINRDYRQNIINLVRKSQEGAIVNNGYLIPGSIVVHSIQTGGKIGSHFTGKMVFDVSYTANYFIPTQGSEIICQILTINKFGILAQSVLFPSSVAIPRQLQTDERFSNPKLGNNFLSFLSPNDLIRVKIIDYKSISNKLSIVGVVTGNLAAAATASDETDEYRAIKIPRPFLLQDDYTIILNESKIDSRSINPFKWLSSTIARFKNYANELNDNIVTYNKLESGDGDGNGDKSATAATTTTATRNDYVNANLLPIIDILNQAIKTIRETTSDVIFTKVKQVVILLNADLTTYQAFLDTVTDQLSTLESPVEPIHPISDDFENLFNSTGLTFFDNQIKSNIENLEEKLISLEMTEEELTSSRVAWTGIAQLLNPYRNISGGHPNALQFKELDREFNLLPPSSDVAVFHLGDTNAAVEGSDQISNNSSNRWKIGRLIRKLDDLAGANAVGTGPSTANSNNNNQIIHRPIHQTNNNNKRVYLYDGDDDRSSRYFSPLEPTRDNLAYEINHHLFNNHHDDKSSHYHYHQFDLVTAVPTKSASIDEPMREFNTAKLFFHQSLWALTLLKEGGHFTMKIYDVYWQVTYEIIALLSLYFNEVYLYKPKSSSPLQSDKYVVCKFFKGIEPDQLAVLRNLSREWNKLTQSSSVWTLTANTLVIQYNEDNQILKSGQLLAYLEIYQEVGLIESYQLGSTITIKLKQPISVTEIESLFFIHEERPNTVNRFLNGNYDNTMRDLVSGYQHRLYLNQLTTLSKAINDWYTNLILSLRNRNLVKDYFGFTKINLAVKDDELIQQILANLKEDRTVVDKSLEWMTQYA